MKQQQIPVSYFELFGLPKQFEIDINLLNERYLAFQQVVHPDIYVTASAQERHIALQKSAFLNEALRVLKDPIARANYLLTECGVTFDVHSSIIIDPEFLMENMQLQESLAITRDKGSINVIINFVQQKYESLMQMLTQNLEKENLVAAKNVLHKLQFLTKLRRNAEELKEQLDENIDF